MFRLNVENQVPLDMSDRKAIAQLKAAMLAAQTLGELHALMEDYSYLEFMQIYNRLTPAQQAKLNAIDEHDCTVQLLATITPWFKGSVTVNVLPTPTSLSTAI